MKNEAPSDRHDRPFSRGAILAIALLLAALTAALYARTGSFEFVNLDDPSYVSHNVTVLRGLSADSLAYAFAGEHSSNWHPLTTLSHMLDVELFGDDAGGHHLTSVGLHALNAALCFLALLALTRRGWTSAIVAALFALHPLRVESVAWISERKDVLSGTFFFLTLLAWARFVRDRSKLNYAFVALALTLGLLAKQMLITLPFLLVLIDLWPLRRPEREGRSIGSLLVEKTPLFALAFGAAGLMWMAQESSGTIGSLDAIPIAGRVLNAFGAVLAYVHLSFAPTGLACFYPHPGIVHADDSNVLMLPGLIGALLVIAGSFEVLRRRRTMPELLVGWFWFLGTLVPVVGLVQVGSQAYADRYTYLPTIGLALMLVAAGGRLVRARPALRMPLAALTALALGGLAFGTWRQVGVWENSEALNEHALAVTERNYVAHNNLGLSRLHDDADAVLAETEFMKALRINPMFKEAVFNLSVAYQAQGRSADAVATLERLLQMDPGHALASFQLGAIKRRGDPQAALVSLRRATELDPSSVRAWLELGNLYLDMSEGTYAEQCGTNVVGLDPNSAAGHILLGLASQQLQDPAAATQHLERAVLVDPENFEARHHLARQLADTGGMEPASIERAKVEVQAALELPGARPAARILLAKLLLFEHDPERAIEQLDLVLVDDPNHPEANDVLGIILLDEKEFDRAEEAFQRALLTDANYAPALANLGALLEGTKREGEALAVYERLLEIDKESAYATNAARGRAWILATSPDESLHDGTEAVKWAEFAMNRTPPEDPNPNRLIVYAAALARAGQYEHAVQVQRAALERALNAPQRTSLQAHLALFEAEQPLSRKR